MVCRGDDAPLDALLMVDSAKRLGGVGIFEADVGRLDLARADDVLRTGKPIEPEIGRGRAENVELARRVVDQRLGIFGDEGVALAAAQHRAGEVVHVGEVVPVSEVPVRRLIFKIDVQAFAAVDAIGRNRKIRAELAELQRVGEMDEIAERRLLTVARDDRIVSVEAHALERVIHPARRDELIERHLGRRTDAPLL